MTFPRRPSCAAIGLLLLCLPAAQRPLSAQGLPSTPLSLLEGRLAVSASASVSVGSPDDRAYYNLTNYDSSLLRLVQVNVDSSLRLNERAALVVSVNGQTPIDSWRWRGYPSSIFLSIKPWRGRSVALRAGIVPPAFGAFLQRRYGSGNLLIGYPLAYQYATSVRANAFPASTDELLRRRGFGAVARYRIGEPHAEPGLPLVNPFGWNPGLGATVGSGPISASVTLTRGGMASGRYAGSHTGWQVSGRGQALIGPGLVLGLSAAHGPYVDRDGRANLDAAVFHRQPRETALGMDAEYSRGYWLIRGEAILNRRTVPAFERPYLSGPLWTAWTAAEARYKLLPALYLAGRVERLSFNEVTGSAAVMTWDANVTRLEVGAGYTLSRNVMAKLAYQRNRRQSSWYPRQQPIAVQVVVWF